MSRRHADHEMTRFFSTKIDGRRANTAAARGTVLADVLGMSRGTAPQHESLATVRLLRTIRESVVGRDAALPGPYGLRRVVYADYTASGRSIEFIEEYIRKQVLPFYANTHTEASGTGRHTTGLREEARRIIHRAVGGGPDDVVIFCGSGSTGAIDKMVGVLDVRISAGLEARHGFSSQIANAERPVVFVGPYEHHSNELPWRESIATVVRIGETRNGRVELDALERALLRFADRPLKIGSFSAASNVTGILSDVARTTELLHGHGALSFWDYAAAGAHLAVDMNPEGSPLLAKDAVFLSPHKLVGGPGSPGVLVAKRRLFDNRVPTVPGGGTISYVNSRVHHFIQDVVAREEGGTPAIVESIRAALSFQLQEAVGHETIRVLEDGFTRRAIDALRINPDIVLLGDLHAERLPIVSFLVRHQAGFLHHNFVVALLSDLFGIQARGGCSCAGPYGHELLGIDRETERGFEREVLYGRLGIKPGWTRIGFSFLTSDAAFDYVLRAVQWVAEHGARFLSDYVFDVESGEWSHRERSARAAARLGSIDYSAGDMSYPAWDATQPESALEAHLQEAANILELHDGREAWAAPALPASFEELRWFPLPDDARARRTLRPRIRPMAMDSVA